MCEEENHSQLKLDLMKIVLILDFILASLVGVAHAEQSTLLTQSEAPLSITNYSNRYRPPDREGDGTVVHRATVTNVSKLRVDAYGVGFYIFDAFRRDMGRPFVGYAVNSIAVEGTDDAGWEQRPGSAFLFRKHGHGLAYIAIVRLEDGSVWRADDASFTRQLEDFELSLQRGDFQKL